jgi:molybdate transport system ATP-binding protein
VSVLDARVVVRLGSLDLDVALAVDAGETVVVVGPNGAGKSTLLRAIAGLQPLDGGYVRIDGADVSAAPAEERAVGVVFQDHVLFPHLSARANVAFGLPRKRRREADAWLARVGLADHASARPDALSGGQAQRVALARALAPSPRVLLLDEPLSALDATTRLTTRRDLLDVLDDHDGACVVVTHDPLEALALADRLVVVEAGRVVQTGTADDVRERPRSSYVADLVGQNLFRGVARAGVVTLAGAELVASTPIDGEAFAVVAPRAVALHLTHPEGTPRNVWPVRVTAVEPGGEGIVRVSVDGPVRLSADVTATSAATLGLAPGVEVWASVKATEVAVYPA